jgi:hypothetical protein
MIGFPDFILEPKELDDVYDGVSTSAHILTFRSCGSGIVPGLSSRSSGTEDRRQIQVIKLSKYNLCARYGPVDNKI